MPKTKQKLEITGESIPTELVETQRGTLAFNALLEENLTEQSKRFYLASQQQLTPEENEAAHREYSEICAKVFREGRLWNPVYVHWTARMMLAMAAEVDALLFHSYEAQSKPSEEVRSAEDLLVGPESSLAGCVHLVRLDALLLAMDLPTPEEGRRVAGYLTLAAQPTEVEGYQHL